MTGKRNDLSRRDNVRKHLASSPELSLRLLHFTWIAGVTQLLSFRQLLQVFKTSEDI